MLGWEEHKNVQLLIYFQSLIIIFGMYCCTAGRVQNRRTAQDGLMAWNVHLKYLAQVAQRIRGKIQLYYCLYKQCLGFETPSSFPSRVWRKQTSILLNRMSHIAYNHTQKKGGKRQRLVTVRRLEENWIRQKSLLDLWYITIFMCI